MKKQDMQSHLRRWWPSILGAAMLLISAGLFIVRSRTTPAAGSDAITDKSAPKSDSLVTLDSTALRLVGIETVAVTPAGADGLIANGTITFDADRVSVIAPRTDGRLTSVRADLGQMVQAGQQLAMIESSEVGQTRGDIARSRAVLDVSRLNYEREKKLFEQSVSSQKDMLDALAAFKSAEADYNAAVAKLRSFGAAGGGGATYSLASPIYGTIVERNATPGQIVGPATTLFTVADLGSVWISVDIYESDANRVHPGSSAVVTARSLPGETFSARVTYAGGIVDSAAHTVKLRLAIPNPARRLRPGMFAEVRLQTPPSASRAVSSSVMVPEDAVQDVNGASVVFVAGRLPGQFIVRLVTVSGTSIGRIVTVSSGLSPGERVVVKGAFQLKAELTKESFGKDEG
ncbi:MAG: efflux RND transporter periplasmic adaptor subunit [Gemmatimonadaceae bacterium]